jgi:vancomycin permeability regulator SanA
MMDREHTTPATMLKPYLRNQRLVSHPNISFVWALYLCNSLGIQAVGVEARNFTCRKSSLFIWNFREQLALLAAFIDLYVDRPIPILGSLERIFLK